MFKTLGRVAQLVFAGFLSIIGLLMLREFSGVRRQLTYREVVSYFVKNKPLKASKGVLVRKSEIGGTYLINQNFLDENDELLKKPGGFAYGRSLRVMNIDEELREAFGNKDMILFT